MFHRRLGILFAVLALMALVLMGRLWQIQIVEGDHWQELARSTRRGRLDLPAVRGTIRDRDGVVLSRDRCSFTTLVFPSRFFASSLIHAVRDACVLLDVPARDEEVVRGRLQAFALEVAERPGGFARRLLELPATAVSAPADVLAERGEPFRRTGPELSLTGPWPLSWYGRGPRARLRTCMQIIRGTPVTLGPATFRRVGEHTGTLGEALGVSPEGLAARLREEARDLAELGRAVGYESLDEVLERIGSRLASELRYVRLMVRAELRRALFLYRLGSAAPSPAELGLERWTASAREAAIPLADADAIRRTAVRVADVLGGGLPREDPQPPAALIVPEEAAHEMFVTASGPVLAAIYEKIISEPDYEESRYLSAYRKRALRRQLIGGRSWTFGKGAHPRVAHLVIGEGRLESKGFDLEPAFVRELDVPPDSPSTQLLLGLVNSSGTAFFGIERELEELRPEAGEAVLHVDGTASVLKQPHHGNAVTTTLSLALQRRLEGLLAQRGAIAVLDATNGEVLGLVTHPAPDPDRLYEIVMDRFDRERERTMYQREMRAGVPGSTAERNRVRDILLQSSAYHLGVENPGQSPPGSVFKVLTILRALEKGVLDPDETVFCNRGKQGRYGCKRHGDMTAVTAIQHSCNFFCYQMGQKLGREALVEGLEMLGFFDPIEGLRKPWGDARGRLLNPREDVRSMAIGQGSIDCSPVRAAALAASVGTGRVVRPTLVLRPGRAPGARWASEANLAVVREGMKQVVFPGGTAHGKSRLQRLRFAGKTGTAQLGEKKPSGTLYDAWFVGYVPWDAPRYAIAVVLDRTHREGPDVAPIAADVAEAVAEVLGEW